jgi:hypothetical protein
MIVHENTPGIVEMAGSSCSRGWRFVRDGCRKGAIHSCSSLEEEFWEFF